MRHEMAETQRFLHGLGNFLQITLLRDGDGVLKRPVNGDSDLSVRHGNSHSGLIDSLSG